MTRSHWWFIAPLAVFTAVTALCTATRSTARAAVLTVDRTDDDPAAIGCDDATPADCSLRGAVLKANGLSEASTINVPAGTYKLSQASTCSFQLNAAGLCLESTFNLTIAGAGAASTVVDANALARVLVVPPRANVAITGLALTDGISGPGTGSGGGAILNAGTLALTDCIVSASSDTGVGGGGIWSSGALTLLRTAVSGNQATSAGGGLFNFGGTMVLTDSTIRDNGGGLNGGGIFNFTNGSSTGMITLNGCTISGNSSTRTGGGIENSNFSVLTLTNSTVSGNRSQSNGGGIITYDSAIVNLNNVTIANNAGAQDRGGGGGISVGATVNMRNTIIAGNTGGFAPDCLASGPGLGGFALTSQGYNLIQNPANCVVTGDTTGNIIGTDPQLGILTDNGGPTQTHALLAGSPAIDAGNPAAPGSGGNACASIDQHGFVRPQGQACDIGAFERTGNFALSGILPTRGGNTGSVLATISGSGFQQGAAVKLSQGGVDIIGASVTVEAGASAIATSFDLTGRAKGPWDMVVMNPDGQSMRIAGAFVIEDTRPPDLWVDIIGQVAARDGQPATYAILYGNRGNVDALGVPLNVSLPAKYPPISLSFALAPPPPQTGQAPLDWTLQPFDVLPDAASGSVNIPLLLPIVPAGSTGILGITLEIPKTAPNLDFYLIAAAIKPPVFSPTLDSQTVTTFVQGAETYAQSNFGISIPPALSPDLEAYARNEFQSAVANGRDALVASVGTQPQFYSLAWLQMDLAFFGALHAQAALQAQQGPVRQIVASLRSVYERVASLLKTSRPAAAYADNCPVITCEENKGRVLPPGCTCITNTRIGPPPIPPPPGCNPQDPSTISRCGMTKDLCQALPNTRIVQTDQGLMCVPNDFDKRICPKFLGPTELPSAASQCRGFLILDSADPNNKAGTSGATSAQFLLQGSPLNYFIHFENEATASAPAQEVVVTDPLDVQRLDLDTFSLGPISFGTITVPMSAGVTHYTGGVDLRPGQNLLVLIDAGLDKPSGMVTWRFTSVDPDTLQLTTDPLAGFLPPNVTPPQGEGSVVFTVQPKAGLTTNTTVCNQARVVFDVNAPIDTPTWCNTIDNTPPTSQVLPLPATQSAASFTVAWAGSDDGSGIAAFTIYVSEDGGPFTALLSDTTDTSTTFVGQIGKTYAFCSVARDLTGNVEQKNCPPVPDTTTMILEPESTPSPTGTLTETPTATETPIQTVTLTATNTPTSTPTLTATVTDTPTDRRTATPADTPTPTETRTATASETPTETATATPSRTRTDTPGQTATDTPLPTATETVVPTTTDTQTQPPTATPTETKSPKPAQTATVIPTCTGALIIESVVARPAVLWPPDHRSVPVTIAVRVSDACDPMPACRIILVRSDEEGGRLGGRHAAPHWVITGDLTVDLRAERSGFDDGRVYTITVACTDATGNHATGRATVAVRHDQRTKQGGEAASAAGPSSTNAPVRAPD